MCWGAYLRVRNFLLILIENGGFQQTSSGLLFQKGKVVQGLKSEAMRWGVCLWVRNFLLILIGNGDFQQTSSGLLFQNGRSSTSSIIRGNAMGCLLSGSKFHVNFNWVWMTS